MKRSILSGMGSMVLLLALTLMLLDPGCKNDDSSTTPGGGGGGLTTFSFGTSGQTFTVPLSGGAARARLTGGTLPYTMTGSPSSSVAVATLNHDTLTVIPVAPGTTFITIADSLGALRDRVVILAITVTGSSSSNYGSGTVTASSLAGNLSISGTGVWPVQAGPSVVAVYDTSSIEHYLLVEGYQRVSGSYYNMVALVTFMQSRVDTGTYLVDTQSPQGFFAAAYNADTTSQADSVLYQSVSGSIRVSSVSGFNVAGTYAVTARKGSGQLIQFTGMFNVTYAVGHLPHGNRAVLRPERGLSAY